MDERIYRHLYGVRDGTTSFMRSLNAMPEIERIFTEDVLNKRDDLLEIAVVGCSSGMEVYSYAMLCETNGFTNYRVDGCDVYQERLEESRRGWYHIWWGTERALTDTRISKGLAYKAKHKKYRMNFIYVSEEIKNRAKFFQHDISIEPLPTLYDIVICTNVLGQPQLGDRENAIKNLLKSLKYGGLVIQNYGKLDCPEIERVNIELQKNLKLPL